MQVLSAQMGAVRPMPSELRPTTEDDTTESVIPSAEIGGTSPTAWNTSFDTNHVAMNVLVALMLPPILVEISAGNVTTAFAAAAS